MSVDRSQRTARRHAKHLISQVRGVLLDEWDPLCVGDNPNLADEYDCVLGKIFATLQPAPSVAAVAKLLAELEADHFGLPGAQTEPRVQAANSLVRLRNESSSWPSVMIPATHDVR